MNLDEWCEKNFGRHALPRYDPGSGCVEPDHRDAALSLSWVPAKGKLCATGGDTVRVLATMDTGTEVDEVLAARGPHWSPTRRPPSAGCTETTRQSPPRRTRPLAQGVRPRSKGFVG